MNDWPGKPGPKRIEIDWETFDKLCQLHCTLVEIAEWFQCSEDTIERRVQETHGCKFADHFKRKSSLGKISLRRRQFEMALGGNVTMLIWLGKQVLNQRDREPEVPPGLAEEVNKLDVTQAHLDALIDIAKAKK